MKSRSGNVSVVNTQRGGGWIMQNATQKRSYTTPKLTVHGTLEEVTQQLQNKGMGASDGYMYMGIPITNIS